jgi:large subunit ribosomal protein L25
VPVPLRTSGKAKGVAAGGELYVLYRELPVRTTPDKIPAAIEVDVTEVELGTTLHVRDLQLPEGVAVALPPERSVISVAEARKRQEEEVDPAAAAAGGAAAAPAAAAAKPAAKSGK